MDTYEYKYHHLGKFNPAKEKDMDKITNLLNEYGNQGWQLEEIVMSGGWITGLYVKKFNSA